MTDFHGMYDDWVPRKCGTCDAVHTLDAMDLVDCGSGHPNACDCDHNSHKASYLCPVCGAHWYHIAPEFEEVTASA